MKHYVGIDLGTTNSAICTYDGVGTRIWKSPTEQNDVTPSAIYFDKRGNKFVGKRAYDSAPLAPDSAAMLFKRLMGTSTPIQFPASNITMTPEECSAEVLKTLFGYLPEDIRNDADTGTVITVPAAFNQMQKNATMQAANMAGIGRIALMQEPVAAVMSVMHARDKNGMFLIYDLGGGTLDVAIAESIGGRVNRLSHGGIAMCGGRDFDRAIFDNVVRPWLDSKFDLPDNFAANPEYKPLLRLAYWASERAKIELSAQEDAVISLSETEARVQDLKGEEIYLDIPLNRETYDRLISERVDNSIQAVREAINNAGLSPTDLERIVFIGGPTNYIKLREKISFELGIDGSMELNPMTAVAEGASLFAESVDWSSQTRNRKSNRGQIATGEDIGLTFNYIARTPDVKARVAVQIDNDDIAGYEFQIDSVDTGWTSGRMALTNNASIELNLSNPGDNTFKVFVFDPHGSPIILVQEIIVISRTAAAIDAIPASHTIGIEMLEKLGGASMLEPLVRAGDSLPKQGSIVIKSAETLKSGTSGSINIKLWEGEIEDPISDNRPIGVLKITGADFDDGVIHAGADLECEYEILDSGSIKLSVSVPSIGATFDSARNFYSRQEGQIDYSQESARVSEEGDRTLSRIDQVSKTVNDPMLEQARDKVEAATSLEQDDVDAENTQEAMEKVLDARKLLAKVKKENLKEIRQIDLNQIVEIFDLQVRKHARPSEETSFDNLVKTAQRSIDRNDREFDNQLDELRKKCFEILWRQDWFAVGQFKHMANSPWLFADRNLFDELINAGEQHMRLDDMDKLREVIAQLAAIQIYSSSEGDMPLDVITNIVRGM